MIRSLQQILLAAIVAVPVIAQMPATTGTTYDRLLVPIAVRNVAGAFNSMWGSELWVTNIGDATRGFAADETCAALCPPFALTAGQARPVQFAPRPSSAPGLIAYVERPSGEVGLFLRVQDASRQALTWGTAIPVVRESEFFAEHARFLNVPVDERFRHMLRIYAMDAATPATVRVEVRDAVLPSPITIIDVTLRPGDDPHAPLYAQLADIVPAMPSNGVIIDVRTLTPGLRFWAFVSVTNNETQHLTTITPAAGK